MKKGVAKAIVVGVLILLLPLMLPATSIGANSQLDVSKLNAPGGIPGPPPDKPKPPDEEEPPVIQYELFIEIDYMPGHKPTPSVLIYIYDYYYTRGIEVTFYVDDQITYQTSYDNGINDAEFWAIEAEYNDEIVDDDQASDDEDVDGDGTSEEFFLKEKWVLFGTTVENEPSVIGYTLVLIAPINPKKADVLAGNYIFIADEGADEWAIGNNIEPYGAEAVVLMHEVAHSIGIGMIEWSVWYGWVEVYDRDTYSVMSYLNVNNAGYYNQWYYSDKYWETRNMEYYSIK